MSFVRRNESGDIVAISTERDAQFTEEVDSNDITLRDFLSRQKITQDQLLQSDLDLIRLIEDMVDLLIEKDVITFTDLPAAAQQKLIARKSLRKTLKPVNFCLLDESDPLF